MPPVNHETDSAGNNPLLNRLQKIHSEMLSLTDPENPNPRIYNGDQGLRFSCLLDGAVYSFEVDEKLDKQGRPSATLKEDMKRSDTERTRKFVLGQDGNELEESKRLPNQAAFLVVKKGEPFTDEDEQHLEQAIVRLKYSLDIVKQPVAPEKPKRTMRGLARTALSHLLKSEGGSGFAKGS